MPLISMSIASLATVDFASVNLDSDIVSTSICNFDLPAFSGNDSLLVKYASLILVEIFKVAWLEKGLIIFGVKCLKFQNTIITLIV